jgi:pimeloyl-ACP methyl ester carboxylesterase
LVTSAILTNRGDTLTDLSLDVVEDSTGIPANFVIQPDIQHTYLMAGQSLEIAFIPLTLTSGTSTRALSSPENTTPSLSNIPGPYRVTANARQLSLPEVVIREGSLSDTCGVGGSERNIIAQCTMPAGSETRIANDWYCTNRPNIDVPISLALLNGGLDVPITNVSVSANFSPGGGAYSHSTSVSFNGSLVGNAVVPSQSYIQGNVSPTSLSLGGVAPSQMISLRSQHSNDAHYTIASGFAVTIDYDEHTREACFSQAEIDAAAGGTLMCPSDPSLNTPVQGLSLDLTVDPTVGAQQNANGSFVFNVGEQIPMIAKISSTGQTNLTEPLQIELTVPRGLRPQGMTIQGEDSSILNSLFAILNQVNPNLQDLVNDILGIDITNQQVTFTYVTTSDIVIGQPFPITLDVVGELAGTYTISGSVSPVSSTSLRLASGTLETVTPLQSTPTPTPVTDTQTIVVENQQIITPTVVLTNDFSAVATDAAGTQQAFSIYQETPYNSGALDVVAIFVMQTQIPNRFKFIPVVLDTIVSQTQTSIWEVFDSGGQKITDQGCQGICEFEYNFTPGDTYRVRYILYNANYQQLGRDVVLISTFGSYFGSPTPTIAPTATPSSQCSLSAINNDVTNNGMINIRPEPSFNEGTFPKTTANKSYPVLASQFILDYTWYLIWADEILVTGWVRGDVVTLGPNCNSFPPTPTPSGILPTPMGTPAATVVPSCRIEIMLGGSDPENFRIPPANSANQVAAWLREMEEAIFIAYPGGKNSGDGKNKQVDDALAQLTLDNNKTCDIIIVGYSAGADSALWLADQYMDLKSNGAVSGSIIGLALLGATGESTGVITSDTGEIITSYQYTNNGSLEQLLTTLVGAGTRVYIIDDKSLNVDTWWGNIPQIQIAGLWFDSDTRREHYAGGDPAVCTAFEAFATNVDLCLVREVLAWLGQ